MSATGICPKCGRAVSPGAPEGLCPSCLLRSVVGKRPQAAAVKRPPPIPGEMPHVVGFELIQEIGRGGMGIVYKARQPKLNRVVAIKLMPHGHLAGEQAKQRVRNEAQAAAQLQHANIVAVFDVGDYDGTPFISMEYVEGENLEKAARSRPFKPEEVAEIVRVLALAVQYAHERGVVHRDLKPSNIMMDANGRPRITDFGLAKYLESDVTLTLSGQALGTPSFMSPEQASGKRGQVGPLTDVYCLGGILYFLLAGRPPFVADSRDEVLSQVLRTDPVAPRRLNASIPRDLQTICLKSLDKKPSQRYETAGELADDLGRYLHKEPIRAKPAHIGTKVWRWCQRQPVAASLLGGLMMVSVFAVVSLLVGFLVAAFQWQRAEQSLKEQRRLREIAEDALRGLENQTATSYQTAGIFQFKVPSGFASASGGKFGVLKRAMRKDLTIGESETISAENPTNFLLGAVEGAARASGKPGTSDPASLSAFRDVALYQRTDGKCLIVFMNVSQPSLISAEEAEKDFRERFQSSVRNVSPRARTRVETGLKVDGHPAIMAEFVDAASGVRNRSYVVFVKGRTGQLNIFAVTQNSAPYDDAIEEDLLRSIRIVLPE